MGGRKGEGMSDVSEGKSEGEKGRKGRTGAGDEDRYAQATFGSGRQR